MNFWDTSAIVPLCVNEPRSSAVRAILVKDPSAIVWWATRTQCVSALVRVVRDGGLGAEGERQARQALGRLADTWTEIQPSEAVRESAERLLAVHPLRAADAFQLAAALAGCGGRPAKMQFVSFDTRLKEAAYKEGFTPLPARL